MTVFLNYISVCVLFSTGMLLAQEPDQKQNYGTLSGQLRTFYSSTINKGSLTDFEALATGAKLNYQYHFNKNLNVGATGYTSINTGIQDLTVPDRSTNRTSRYEEGLFDVTDLNKKYILLLGELYINYKLEKHDFNLGRMKLNSPLVNGQDGRMIPSLFQGLHYRYKPNKQYSYQLGVFNKIAPRSTGRFYGVAESIGTYPVGRDWSGRPAQYAGNTESDFLILSNAELQLTDKLHLKVWEYYIDNVSNSLYLNPKLNISPKFIMQAEWLHQNRIGNGGNAIDSLRYFRANTADVLGVQVNYNWNLNKSSLSLSYNRILPKGQFIFPRSWGREFLFSFQKRERSEGSADNHALVLYYDQVLRITNSGSNLQSSFSLGHHWKPGVTDARQNKYALPSYTQINWDLFFNFDKVKNLKPELLLVAKFSGSEVPDNPNFYLNKTDLFLVNLILNYNF